MLCFIPKSIFISFIDINQTFYRSFYTASVGREFLFGLIDDYGASSVTINIASETSGKVYINAPAVGLNRHYLINAGTKEIVLPLKIIQTSNTTVENKSVHIISDTDIYVNVLVSGDVYSSGGFLAFPLQEPSKPVDFVVASFLGYSTSYPSEILLTASSNATKLSVELPDDLTGTFVQNNTLQLTLDEYQTYQLQSKYDLSGTYIHSSAPISVTTGTKLAGIGNSIYGTGYIIDQMPPTAFLGTRFIAPPLHTRSGYLIKIIAPENHIDVNLTNSTGTYSITVYRGLVQNILVNNIEPVYISSIRPVMVAQYGLDYGVDSKGGEIMMIVPSISNYMDKYTFLISAKQSLFSNFLCVISPTKKVSDIHVDSQPLSTAAVSASYISTILGNFTISVVRLSPGRHTVASQSRTTTFGALLYGFYSYSGYGFPLGMRKSAKGNGNTKLAKYSRRIMHPITHELH